jgi:protein ImuB
MEASVTAVIQVRQRGLFAQQEPAGDDGSVRRLLDRLSTRLGRDAVVRPQLLPEAVPEQAVGFAPVAEPPLKPQPHTDPPIASARPLILLPRPAPIRVNSTDGRPESFYWQRHHQVAWSTETERIATA